MRRSLKVENSRDRRGRGGGPVFPAGGKNRKGLLQEEGRSEAAENRTLDGEAGFAMVLLLRIAPFVPFDLVSYSVGAAGVRLRAFLPATVIGTLPGTFAYNYLGSSLTKSGWREWLIAGCVFAAASSGNWKRIGMIRAE